MVRRRFGDVVGVAQPRSELYVRDRSRRWTVPLHCPLGHFQKESALADTGCTTDMIFELDPVVDVFCVFANNPICEGLLIELRWAHIVTQHSQGILACTICKACGAGCITDVGCCRL